MSIITSPSISSIFSRLITNKAYINNQKDFSDNINILIKLHKLDDELPTPLMSAMFDAAHDLDKVNQHYQLVYQLLQQGKDFALNHFDINNTLISNQNEDVSSDTTINIKQDPLNIENFESKHFDINNNKNQYSEDVDYLLAKYREFTGTFEDFQNQFNDFIDGSFTATGFTTPLCKGYLDNGAGIVNNINNYVQNHLQENQSNDWLNVSSESLGLRNHFSNQNDFLNAIDNACNNIEIFMSAVTGCIKDISSTYQIHILDTKA